MRSTETHRTKCYGGSRQTYEAAISCMRLMHGIGKVVAELVQNLLYLGVVLVRNMLPNEPLKTVRLRLASMPEETLLVGARDSLRCGPAARGPLPTSSFLQMWFGGQTYSRAPIFLLS